MKLATKLSLVIALVTTISVISCTKGEVATTLGVIAIGAAIGAIGVSPTYPSHYQCQGGYRTECRDYYDYYNYYHHDCAQVYDPCLNQIYVNSNGSNHSNFSALVEKKETILTEDKFSDKFSMGLAGSKLFIDALYAAKGGSLKEIEALGLKKKDIQNIAKFKLPTEAGLDALAKSLDQNKTVVTEMVQTLVDTAKAQKEAKIAEGK